MNSSQFMDKQILGLSASGTGGGTTELFDLMNPQEESNGSGGGDGMLRKEEILPNYDFQPIRTVGSSSSADALDGVGRSSWGSADPNISPPSNIRYTNILEPRELPKVSHDKDKGSYDVAIMVAEIDRTVKKYADNLLHSLEAVSSRLSQLESRTHNLESSLDELKVSVGNNSGSIDGKLRQLENILREVETGVQVLRDKQEIAEAQQQLIKLQQTSSKQDHYQPPLESSNTAAPDSQQQQQQQTPPPPAYRPPPPSVAQPQAQPSFPTPNAPPPPLQQNLHPQYPPQLPQTQLTSLPSLPREHSYFPPPGAQPPPSQPQPQPPPPQQQYQPPPQYSQPMPSPQPLNPSPQLQPPSAHHPEESATYMPQQSQTYPPSIRQPAPLTQPLPTSAPPQYYAPSSGQMSFPSSYGLSPGLNISDPYPYSGSPSNYNSSAMKQSPFSNSPPSPSGGGGSNYSRLPTAKILPQAVPNSSGSGGNRVPVDDVVDKVVTMGFSREQVRATVRKLTENGQSVDLNVVLDKLMNGGGGEMIQPQKGWFGR